jgi:hypothetical protein
MSVDCLAFKPCRNARLQQSTVKIDLEMLIELAGEETGFGFAAIAGVGELGDNLRFSHGSFLFPQIYAKPKRLSRFIDQRAIFTDQSKKPRRSEDGRGNHKK